MRHLLIAALLFVPSQEENYFPLEKGNEWTYSVSTGQAMTIKVVDTAKIKGVDCAVLETTFGNNSFREFLAVDSEGLKIYKVESGLQSLTYEKPGLRVKLPYKKGETWTVDLKEGAGINTYHYKSEGSETVRLTAGSYDCVKVSTTLNTGQGKVVVVNWYGKGAGLVKQTMEAGGQTMTAELTKANLKSGKKTEPEPGGLKCAKCGAAAKEGAKFCSECGAALEQKKEDLKCPKCKAEVKSGAKFCEACGAPLGKGSEAPKGPELVRYESKDGKVLLYHPKDWKIAEGDMFGEGTYTVTVEDPDEISGVMFMSVTLSDEIKDSVQMASVFLGNLGKEFPDLKVSQMKSTKDRARTSVELSMTSGKDRVVGHFYFFRQARAGTLYALMAREDKWEEKRGTLATIIANLAYAPEGVKKVLREGKENAGKTKRGKGETPTPAALVKEASKREGKKFEMQRVRARDASFELDIPKGWSFEGEELNGRVFADARKRHGGLGAGYTIFYPGSNFVRGYMVANYAPPAQALDLVLQNEGIGRGVTVLSESSTDGFLSAEDLQLVKMAQAQGVQIDLRILFVEFTLASTSEKGCGIFVVDCMAYPMAMGWAAIVQGYWAPADVFGDYLPLYIRMGESTKRNEEWWAAKQRQMAAETARHQRNLMKSLAELRESYDRYNESYWERSRSQDYMSWAWSQTTLGQGSWVSEREGAEVVRTDSWGLTDRDHGRVDGREYNHANFKGRKPWTGEQLNEIDTRAEYEKYLRGK